jgi:hypothetical protein
MMPGISMVLKVSVGLLQSSLEDGLSIGMITSGAWMAQVTYAQTQI